MARILQFDRLVCVVGLGLFTWVRLRLLWFFLPDLFLLDVSLNNFVEQVLDAGILFGTGLKVVSFDFICIVLCCWVIHLLIFYHVNFISYDGNCYVFRALLLQFINPCDNAVKTFRRCDRVYDYGNLSILIVQAGQGSVLFLSGCVVYIQLVLLIFESDLFLWELLSGCRLLEFIEIKVIESFHNACLANSWVAE